MRGKNGEQSNHRLVVPTTQHPRLKIRGLQLPPIDSCGTAAHQANRSIETFYRRSTKKHLPGLQVSQYFISDAHGHRRLTQAGVALERLRPWRGVFFESLLQLQASGAGWVRLRHPNTKRIHSRGALQGRSK